MKTNTKNKIKTKSTGEKENCTRERCIKHFIIATIENKQSASIKKKVLLLNGAFASELSYNNGVHRNNRKLNK